MKFKLIFATATAMSLLMGSALAQNNTDIDQNGDLNSADVDQSPGTGNNAAPLIQNGDRNVLTIDQTTDDNDVGGVTQTSDEAAGSTPNTLIVTQGGGDGNDIDLVQQTNLATTGIDDNRATLTQAGAGNNIGAVVQNGNGNTANLTQTGDNNGTGDFDEWSFSGAVAGVNPLVDLLLNVFSISYPGVAAGTATQLQDDNTINYNATSDGNQFGFLQDGDANTISAASGTGDGNKVAIVQFRDGNVATSTQSGAGNDTGIFQQGDLNGATVTSGGDDNNFGVGQYGNGNNASIGTSSDGNIAAAIQAGDGNLSTTDIDAGNGNIAATVQILGNGNIAGIDIDGAGNIVAAAQVGSNNDAVLKALGNDNFAVALQGGNGNNTSVDIDGDGNNQPILASFSGAAALVAGTTIDGLTGLSLPFIGSFDLLQPGLMTQYGTSNGLDVSVDGNDNLFATLQNGNGNAINGVVSGSDNQFAVSQTGNDNLIDLLQSGADNNAGVSIIGDDNKLNIKQEQTIVGAGNTMSVSITGNDNNNFPETAPLSGDAKATRDLYAPGLNQGSLFQTGSDNSLILTVASDLNAFATLQDGTGNEITHDISGGNANQAVIVQKGNGNVSNTTQFGSNNNIGVSQ